MVKPCEIWTYARHPDLVFVSSYLESYSIDTWERRFRVYETHSNEIHEQVIELRKKEERMYIRWFLTIKV